MKLNANAAEFVFNVGAVSFVPSFSMPPPEPVAQSATVGTVADETQDHTKATKDDASFASILKNGGGVSSGGVAWGAKSASVLAPATKMASVPVVLQPVQPPVVSSAAGQWGKPLTVTPGAQQQPAKPQPSTFANMAKKTPAVVVARASSAPAQAASKPKPTQPKESAPTKTAPVVEAAPPPKPKRVYSKPFATFDGPKPIYPIALLMKFKELCTEVPEGAEVDVFDEFTAPPKPAGPRANKKPTRAGAGAEFKRLEPLQRSETGWKKVASEDDREKACAAALALLNKLSHENTPRLAPLFAAIEGLAASRSVSKAVAACLLNKAVDEPPFSSLYASLVARLVDALPAFLEP
jgi:hypothetical protein